MMENVAYIHVLQKSKCSIFHNIFKYIALGINMDKRVKKMYSFVSMIMFYVAFGGGGNKCPPSGFGERENGIIHVNKGTEQMS